MFESLNSTTYSRKLLLIKIKTYYRNLGSKGSKEISCLDDLCNDADLQKEMGFVRLLGDSDLTCLFYSYRNSISFLAIKINNVYRVVSDTYTKATSFSDLISYDIGLCYEIFLREMELINDPGLSEALYDEAQILKKYFETKEKTLLF